ncbi:hypothetical protein ACS0TY_030235 [Phlomoides rotata]
MIKCYHRKRNSKERREGVARDSCLSRVTAGVAVRGAVDGAVGAVYGTYEAIRYKIPGLLKVRYIGQTMLGSAAVFGLFLGAGSLIHCDELQFIKKGAHSVTKYGAVFKNLCNQLFSMGCSIDEMDKSRRFLRGLGADFHNFSTAQINLTPLPSFPDLLSKMESHDLFTTSLDAQASSAQTPAFYA